MLDNFDFEDEEVCPFISALLPLLILNKPFGMSWPLDKVEWFLKKRGYEIIERDHPTKGKVKIAIKEGDNLIPSDSNLTSAFSNEVQDIILEKLIN